MAVSDKEEIIAYAADRRKICGQLKEMIVDKLCLDIEPDFLTDDQPLFGRGLELDSIDSLELAVGLFDKFGVTIVDGEVEVFSSVNYMADYVMANAQEKAEALPDVSAGGFVDLDA